MECCILVQLAGERTVIANFMEAFWGGGRGRSVLGPRPRPSCYSFAVFRRGTVPARLLVWCAFAGFRCGLLWALTVFFSVLGCSVLGNRALGGVVGVLFIT